MLLKSICGASLAAASHASTITILLIAASTALAAPITTQTCADSLDHQPIVKTCSVNDPSNGTAYSALTEWIPDVGMYGKFGLTFTVNSRSTLGGTEGITVKEDISEIVKADGPKRQGYVNLLPVIDCYSADVYCSDYISFAQNYSRSASTIPVTLGDPYTLTAGVSVMCYSTNTNSCYSSGSALMYFQFFEADGFTAVGFTDPPLATPEPETYWMLIIGAGMLAVCRIRKKVSAPEKSTHHEVQ